MLLLEAKEAMQRLRTMCADLSLRIPSSAIQSMQHIGGRSIPVTFSRAWAASVNENHPSASLSLTRAGRGSFANVELAWYTDPQGVRKEVAVKRFRLEVLANDMCLQVGPA